jgi:acyl-CoA reductase-like NAD-dependent aldehyde dehydrogenase
LKRILNETSSGNVTVNDILFQTVEPEIGFGGVGASGSGRFAGYEGFK